MTKWTDMQLVLLTSACQREDGSLLPPPESLTDQTDRIRKTIEALVKKGLVAEKEGMTTDQCWRNDGGLTIGVVVTDAGRSAIGIEQEPQVEEEPQVDGDCRASGSVADVPPTDEAASRVQNEDPTAVPSEPPSKIAQVLVLLRRQGGASLDEIVSATGWLPHTSRAALTGLRKKGHDIAREKIEGTTRYQIKAIA